MAKYLKLDSELGYIEDPTLIEYAKFNNLRHTILGFMMGDFDSNGNYYIDPTIVSQLVAMKKHIIEVDENIELCHGELRLDKPFTFVITYEKDRVTLSLLEKLNYEANFKLNSGAYSNINEYILDEIETSGIVDRNLVYKQWNVDTFGGHEIDIFSCDDAVLEKYFGITKRFKYLLKANSILIDKEKELEEIEAEYGNRILELLDIYPELKKLVEAEILKSIKDKRDFISIDKLFFAKTLNEVIDKAIDENIGVLTEEERIAFDKEKINITRDINIKRDMVLDINSTIVAENELDPTRVMTINTNGEEQSMSVAELAEEFATREKSANESREATSEREKFINAINKISGDLLIPKEKVEVSSSSEPANLVVKKADDIKKNSAAEKGGSGKSGGGGSKSGKSTTKKPPAKQKPAAKEGADGKTPAKAQAYIPYSVKRLIGSNNENNNNPYNNIKKTENVNVRIDKVHIDQGKTVEVALVETDTSI
ncbi:MAG: hypothetical protein IKC49_01850 [Clostridia bacterium]|nr:hypothetical protein [Clostridia bacterium]